MKPLSGSIAAAFVCVTAIACGGSNPFTGDYASSSAQIVLTPANGLGFSITDPGELIVLPQGVSNLAGTDLEFELPGPDTDGEFYGMRSGSNVSFAAQSFVRVFSEGRTITWDLQDMAGSGQIVNGRLNVELTGTFIGEGSNASSSGTAAVIISAAH
jgi:hypothetical protein